MPMMPTQILDIFGWCRIPHSGIDFSSCHLFSKPRRRMTFCSQAHRAGLKPIQRSHHTWMETPRIHGNHEKTWKKKHEKNHGFLMFSCRSPQKKQSVGFRPARNRAICSGAAMILVLRDASAIDSLLADMSTMKRVLNGFNGISSDIIMANNNCWVCLSVWRSYSDEFGSLCSLCYVTLCS